HVIDINLPTSQTHRSKTAKRAAGDMYRCSSIDSGSKRRGQPTDQTSFSSSKNSQRTSEERRLQAIKRELTQIKHRGYLLESLERMEKDHGKESQVRISEGVQILMSDVWTSQMKSRGQDEDEEEEEEEEEGEDDGDSANGDDS
uniref:Uncharacterized protein n=1 Tax=Labrus bergylta TaxID=56723 RepID=A0A3Q3GJ50_9LABR